MYACYAFVVNTEIQIRLHLRIKIYFPFLGVCVDCSVHKFILVFDYAADMGSLDQRHTQMGLVSR